MPFFRFSSNCKINRFLYISDVTIFFLNYHDTEYFDENMKHFRKYEILKHLASIIYWYECIKKKDITSPRKGRKYKSIFFDQTYHGGSWRIRILFYRIIWSHHQNMISIIGNIFLIYLENASLQLRFKRRCQYTNWSL